MKVQKNHVVELTYELIVDGKLADKATQDRPLDYIHGTLKSGVNTCNHDHKKGHEENKVTE